MSLTDFEQRILANKGKPGVSDRIVREIEEKRDRQLLANSTPRYKGRTLAALFMAGASIGQLAALAGIKRSTVSMHIKNNVTSFHRSQRNKNFNIGQEKIKNQSEPTLSNERVAAMYRLAIGHPEADPIKLAQILFSSTTEVEDVEEPYGE